MTSPGYRCLGSVDRPVGRAPRWRSLRARGRRRSRSVDDFDSDFAFESARVDRAMRHGCRDGLCRPSSRSPRRCSRKPRCFKGLTDELLTWQTKELLERETERRGIAVLVRPELVVEIALDGVQSSTRYPGGVALRFRAREALSAGQERRGVGHDRRPARAAPSQGRR
jgi:hypothetical protein